MKKILGIVFAVLLVVGAIGCYVWEAIWGKKDVTPTKSPVECLIQQDKAYMDSLPGKIVFFESQVVLDTAFNVADKFSAMEVTNIFQQELDTTVNVYEFKHTITIHKNTTWMEDVAVNADSIGMSFGQAFNRAKQSNLTPSKSKHITLRNPLGPTLCNPQYIIGNEDFGIMFVDSKNGNVSDKNPAFNK